MKHLDRSLMLFEILSKGSGKKSIYIEKEIKKNIASVESWCGVYRFSLHYSFNFLMLLVLRFL